MSPLRAAAMVAVAGTVTVCGLAMAGSDPHPGEVSRAALCG